MNYHLIEGLQVTYNVIASELMLEFNQTISRILLFRPDIPIDVLIADIAKHSASTGVDPLYWARVAEARTRRDEALPWEQR